MMTDVYVLRSNNDIKEVVDGTLQQALARLIVIRNTDYTDNFASQMTLQVYRDTYIWHIDKVPLYTPA